MAESHIDDDDPVASSYALTAKELRKGRDSADFRTNARYAYKRRDEIFKEAHLGKGKRKRAAKELMNVLAEILNR